MGYAAAAASSGLFACVAIHCLPTLAQHLYVWNKTNGSEQFELDANNVSFLSFSRQLFWLFTSSYSSMSSVLSSMRVGGRRSAMTCQFYLQNSKKMKNLKFQPKLGAVKVFLRLLCAPPLYLLFRLRVDTFQVARLSSCTIGATNDVNILELEQSCCITRSTSRSTAVMGAIRQINGSC
jgi:hypothetical protein